MYCTIDPTQSRKKIVHQGDEGDDLDETPTCLELDLARVMIEYSFSIIIIIVKSLFELCWVDYMNSIPFSGFTFR